MPAPRPLLGPAGWSYPDWHGPVYPRPMPRGLSPLAYLARYVDLVEVNGTFYGIPDPAQVARWPDKGYLPLQKNLLQHYECKKTEAPTRSARR